MPLNMLWLPQSGSWSVMAWLVAWASFIVMADARCKEGPHSLPFCGHDVPFALPISFPSASMDSRVAREMSRDLAALDKRFGAGGIPPACRASLTKHFCQADFFFCSSASHEAESCNHAHTRQVLKSDGLLVCPPDADSRVVVCRWTPWGAMCVRAEGCQDGPHSAYDSGSRCPTEFVTKDCYYQENGKTCFVSRVSSTHCVTDPSFTTTAVATTSSTTRTTTSTTAYLRTTSYIASSTIATTISVALPRSTRATSTVTASFDNKALPTTVTTSSLPPTTISIGSTEVPNLQPSTSPLGDTRGRTRRYIIQAETVLWDYAPMAVPKLGGRRLHAGTFGLRDSSFWIDNTSGRIGTQYYKCVYREYAEDTNGQLHAVGRTSEWKHLGIVGPILRAEVGDTLVVRFINRCDFPATMHPHGVRYSKANEGARYGHGMGKSASSSNDAHHRRLQSSAGNYVEPGGEFEYVWEVPERAGPGAGEYSSKFWTYHSHIDSTAETNDGLVGGIIVVRRGHAMADARPKDVDHEFVLLFAQIDENAAHSLRRNIAEFVTLPGIDLNTNQSAVNRLRYDEDFYESNVFSSINGIIHGDLGNLQGLRMRVGERVRWHLMAMGSLFAVHVPHWVGQTLVSSDGRHVDVVPLTPGATATIDMVPDTAGTFELYSVIPYQRVAGMAAQYIVDKSLTGEKALENIAPSQPEIVYRIVAEEVWWDYSPDSSHSSTTSRSGDNYTCPAPRFFEIGEDPALAWLTSTPDRIGKRYRKCVFKEYRRQRTKEWQHLGILGPTLRAEVGERIRVELLNLCSFKIDFQVRGVRAAVGSNNRATWPGLKQNYSFDVIDASGPGKGDFSSRLWLYSGTTGVGDGNDFASAVNAGLVGPIIITQRGEGRRPRGVDREFVLFFGIFDENLSKLFPASAASLLSTAEGRALVHQLNFYESNRMHAINGLVFNSLPGLKMKSGEHVRWHLASLGGQRSIHAPHWHGNTLLTSQGQRLDTVDLVPGALITLDMFPDAPGKWSLACRVNNNFQAGMSTEYLVVQTSSKASPTHTGIERLVYLRAEQIVWDYAPQDHNMYKDLPFARHDMYLRPMNDTDIRSDGYPSCPLSHVNVPSMDMGGSWTMPLQTEEQLNSFPAGVGKQHLKCVYRRYSTASFKEVVRDDEWEDLGLLKGALLRAEVGDYIQIVLDNDCSFEVGIHIHGAKRIDADADEVLPGNRRAFRWYVPERSGPGPADGSSIFWPLYSGVHSVAGMNAGLVGGLIVTRKGLADGDGRPKDVDKEIVLAFNTFDENASPLFSSSAKRFLPKRVASRAAASLSDPRALRWHQRFYEQNMMHTVNGYIFSNNAFVEATASQRTRWYIFALGGNQGVHSVHWHGNVLQTFGDEHLDVFQLLPGAVATLDMKPDALGMWTVHCHVNHHIHAGMLSAYNVSEPCTPAKGLDEGISSIVRILVWGSCALFVAAVVGSALSVLRKSCGRRKAKPHVPCDVENRSPCSRVTIAVEGMTCSACSGCIENGLASHEGCISANVNLLNHTARVLFSHPSTPCSLLEVIEDLGFGGTVVSVEEDHIAELLSPRGDQEHTAVATLQISGMTCTTCSDTISNAVKNIEGVLNVGVNIFSHAAVITFQNPATLQSLQDAISDIGFTTTSCTLENKVQTRVSRFKASLPQPCATCALRLDTSNCTKANVHKFEAFLSKRVGVSNVSLGLSSRDFRVSYWPEQVGARALLAEAQCYDVDWGGDSRLKSHDHLIRLHQERLCSFLVSLPPTAAIFVIAFVIPNIWPDSASNEQLQGSVCCGGGLSVQTVLLIFLSVPVQFFAGLPMHKAAAAALCGGHFSMDVLISVGTNMAFFYSLIVTLVWVIIGLADPSALIQKDSRHNGAHGHHVSVAPPPHFFEMSAVLLCIILLGRTIEGRARRLTGECLETLSSNWPGTVRLADTEGKSIPIDLIELGDVLRVSPGDVLPCDGTLASGSVQMNESILTGENHPIRKKIGDPLVAGSSCAVGAGALKVEAIGANTSISQIAQIVDDAQCSKPAIANLAWRVSSVFVPTIIAMSTVTFIVWLVLGFSELVDVPSALRNRCNSPLEEARLAERVFFAMRFSLAVMMMACPCAFGLATPTAVMAAVAGAARRGCLIKTGRALEAGHQLRAVVFDKTGTITMGAPVVKQLIICKFHAALQANVAAVAPVLMDIPVSWIENLSSSPRSLAPPSSEQDMALTIFWTVVGALEAPSQHPLAKALHASAMRLIRNFPDVEDWRDVVGFGVEGRIEGFGTVRVGRPSWVSRQDKPPSEGETDNTPPAEDEPLVRIRRRSSPSCVAGVDSPGADCQFNGNGILDGFVSKLGAEGAVVVAVAVEGQVLGAVALQDALRPEAPYVVRSLQSRGCEVWLCSGDHESTTKAIAAELGLTRWVGEALPLEKAKLVSKLVVEHRGVAFVGDGINDAPALAAATLGVAFGAGSQVMIDAADVIIIPSSLRDILNFFRISARTVATIRVNFFWAFCFNIVGLPLAAGLAYPTVHLPPLVAGSAMAFSSLVVVLNSVWLRYAITASAPRIEGGSRARELVDARVEAGMQGAAIGKLADNDDTTIAKLADNDDRSQEWEMLQRSSEKVVCQL